MASWDLSHGRRLVYFFSAVRRSGASLGLTSDSWWTRFQTGYANQLLYKVFNRDFKNPSFANFMDGTNGWYRVNYSGRASFGYAPGAMSESFIEGGFLAWRETNPDFELLAQPAWEVLARPYNGAYCLRAVATLPEDLVEQLGSLSGSAVCKNSR